MTSRLGIKERFDIEHRLERPYDLVLRLEGSSADWFFGRFKTPERAAQIGLAQMSEAREECFPFRRKCRGYTVIDSRTGEKVELHPVAKAA